MSALRAFEATARLNSMSLAAQELNMSQGAVSKQVKSLEEFLERPLFVRLVRRIELTPAGSAYFNVVAELLDEIERATKLIRTGSFERREVVRFSSYYGFNIQWLLPQLVTLKTDHPNLDVRLSSAPGEAIDFMRDGVNCAIRTGFGDWANCNFEQVAPIHWRPVCSPEFKGAGDLKAPTDMTKHTLLRAAGSPGIWRKWFESVGVPDPNLDQTMDLDQGALCYEAAMRGVGIAIADCMLVKRHVAEGRLMFLFDDVYVDPRSYYFLYEQSQYTPGVQTFKAWLMGHMQADSAELY